MWSSNAQWRRWVSSENLAAVVGQVIKGLPKYGTHLPWRYLWLTAVLPALGLRKILCHSMFFSPKGYHGHFVAKDFFLEIQNYWLKYFYNHNGTGTNITWLEEKISVNFPMVWSTRYPILIFIYTWQITESDFFESFNLFSEGSKETLDHSMPINHIESISLQYGSELISKNGQE